MYLKSVLMFVNCSFCISYLYKNFNFLFDNSGNIENEKEDGSNGPSTMDEETETDDTETNEKKCEEKENNGIAGFYDDDYDY